MPSWSPKPGPAVTTGRMMHGLVGALISLGAGHLGGYSACAWGLVGSIALGLGWEQLTPLIAQPLGWSWSHPDLLDFAAFVVGGLAGVGTWFALRRRRPEGQGR
jgi:hypothetical protein